MNEFVLFLFQAIIVSLSGVMAPGAMTAATIAQGTRNRWAGTLIFVTHDADIAERTERVIRLRDGLVERVEAGKGAG